MGLAWFDDDPPEMGERGLRTGGLPLLPPHEPWPECPRCGGPLLFRAQLPLALTSLTGFDDERLMLIFECHAVLEEGPCDGGTALLVDGDLAPRAAPPSRGRDVVLVGLGRSEAEVMRIVQAVSEWHGRGLPPLPRVLLHDAPPSIARETVRAVQEAGGEALVRDSNPATLGGMHGGTLVPFDDGPRATYRTTLPPLHELSRSPETGVMRGLVGAGTPGYRDHATTCSCGRPTRTAVRLVADRGQWPTGVRLGMSVAQVCLRCDRASLHRLEAGGASTVRLAG